MTQEQIKAELIELKKNYLSMQKEISALNKHVNDILHIISEEQNTRAMMQSNRDAMLGLDKINSDRLKDIEAILIAHGLAKPK